MKERILSLLPPEYPWAEHFHWLEETGSTNDDLKAMARQGAPHGTVLIADRQTGGHGRLGRSFHSPADTGLYMTVAYTTERPLTEAVRVTAAASVAALVAVVAAEVAVCAA